MESIGAQGGEGGERAADRAAGEFAALEVLLRQGRMWARVTSRSSSGAEITTNLMNSCRSLQ